MSYPLFTDIWVVRDGTRHNTQEPVIILEKITKDPQIIFDPATALWVGKELIKAAKKARKKVK